MDVLPEVLLVDGHSMIFQWPELAVVHRQSPERGRLALIEKLVRLADNTGRTVMVVFDGQGAKASRDPLETRLQVFYSKSGQTADSIIERLVAKYSATHRITVATDDHLERTTVTAFGGEWISSRQLQEEMEVGEAKLQDSLRKLRRR
jgi:predicted RNA-binding protein with PIN domain